MGNEHPATLAPAPENVFEFPAGLFGFPTVTRFIIEEVPGGGEIIKQMIAVDEPAIGFTIVHPFAFFDDYNPEIPATELLEIEAESLDQTLLYVIANVPDQFKEATANLRAPLLFNPFARKGRQVILLDDRFKTRERLFRA